MSCSPPMMLGVGRIGTVDGTGQVPRGNQVICPTCISRLAQKKARVTCQMSQQVLDRAKGALPVWSDISGSSGQLERANLCG